MITREEMMAPMLEACPSFLPVWNGIVSEWKRYLEDLGGEDEFPLYQALDALASHVFKLTLTEDRKALKPIFEVIERWLVNGDDYVRQACEVGVFERLKHAKGPKSSMARFKVMLGPVSRKAWDQV